MNKREPKRALSYGDSGGDRLYGGIQITELRLLLGPLRSIHVLLLTVVGMNDG